MTDDLSKCRHSTKDRGSKTDYSQTTQTTTTDNIETYQIHTIRGATKTYIAREHLLFPWVQAPLNVTAGETVKYTVEKNKLILLEMARSTRHPSAR